MASSSHLGGVDEEDEEEWLEFEEMTSLGGTNWIIDLCKLFGWFRPFFLLSSFFILHPSTYILRAWRERISVFQSPRSLLLPTLWATPLSTRSLSTMAGKAPGKNPRQ
jgi:hypothetical protein